MNIKIYVSQGSQRLPTPKAIAHCLIGPPGSGKSTLADRIASHLPGSITISTDQIRGDRYGDPGHQGSWAEIGAIARQRVAQAQGAGLAIVYDATNGERDWRLDWLQGVATLPLDWIGWHLQTPLPLCQQWNRGRCRQVPPPVIDRLHRALSQHPPTRAEGFRQVYRILPTITDQELTQILRVWHSL